MQILNAKLLLIFCFSWGRRIIDSKLTFIRTATIYMPATRPNNGSTSPKDCQDYRYTIHFAKENTYKQQQLYIVQMRVYKVVFLLIIFSIG